jgi:hypothetical protein
MHREYLLVFTLSSVAIISAALASTQQQQKGTSPATSSQPPALSASPSPSAASNATAGASSPSVKPAVPLTPQAQALQLYRTGKFDAAIDAYTKGAFRGYRKLGESKLNVAGRSCEVLTFAWIQERKAASEPIDSNSCQDLFSCQMDTVFLLLNLWLTKPCSTRNCRRLKKLLSRFTRPRQDLFERPK